MSVIVAETLVDAQLVAPLGTVVVEDTENVVGIGWSYDGTSFVAPYLPDAPKVGE